MKRQALLLALAASSTFATTAQAQSLPSLFDAARGYDAAYLGARALAESAQYRVDQVHALRRPSVSLSTQAGRTINDSPVSDTRNRAITGTLSAVQPLFNRPNDAAIEQADRSLEAAQADLRLAEQDLMLRLAQAYFDVLGAEDTLETTRAGKRAIARQRSAARRNFEVGTATITDVREAQARYDLATAQDIAADNDLTTRRIALDELVGRRGVRPWRLAQPVQLPPLMPDAVDDWVAQADTSPAVRRAVVGYDVARLETEKARAQSLPTVELNGSYATGTGRLLGTQVLTSTGQPIGAGIPVDVRGRTTNAGVNLLLRMPLFAGFAIQDRVKETLHLEDQSRYNLEATRRIAAQSVRQVFFGVQSLAAQALSLEAAERSSQSALDATLLGYRVGVRVNIDVLNAQSQLYTAQRDLALARYAVLLNRLKLRQAAGSLVPGDLAALESLLTSEPAPVTPESALADPLPTALIPARSGEPVVSRSVPLEQPFAEAVANAFLARWTTAWSRRDLEAYFALYEPDFTGPTGTHADWALQRRLKIEGKHAIEIKVSELAVTPGPGTVVLRFQQSYRGDDLRQTSRKRITLRRDGDRWRVAEETETP